MFTICTHRWLFARYDVSERILVCSHPDKEFTGSSRDRGRLIATRCPERHDHLGVGVELEFET